MSGGGEPEAPTGSAKPPSARTLLGLYIKAGQAADEREAKVVDALLEQQRAWNTTLRRVVVLVVASAFALAGVKVAAGWFSAEPGAAEFDAKRMVEDTDGGE